GWANAVLIARVTSTEGPESVRFAANSAWHEETMRFSRRLGGHAVASRSRFAVDCPRGQLLEGPSPAMNAGGAA
ncbi:MAG: hypothetical protein KJO38_02055, partial [Gammaproteobacteria bacterium]|nr:hypothetical protein [Gammaproteobacteria bacterium]